MNNILNFELFHLNYVQTHNRWANFEKYVMLRRWPHNNHVIVSDAVKAKMLTLKAKTN